MPARLMVSWLASVSLVLALGGLPSSEMTPASSRPREVVVLYSDRGTDVDAVLRDRLQAAPGGVHLVTENLDLARVEDQDYRQRLAGILRRKYQGRSVDLVVPVNLPAVRFMAEQGPAAFPGVPAVFCAVDAERLRGLALPPFIAGVSGRLAVLPHVEAALRLQPDTDRLVIVAGESSPDRYWRERALRDLSALADRVTLEVPRGLTMPELLDRMRALPDRAIVIYLTYTEDGSGTLYSNDAFRLIAEASRVPVYASHGQAIGAGAVGGFVFDYDHEAEKAAAVALRVLRGERTEDIGVHEAPGMAFIYDWRQLRRWKLPESRLPAGSEIRFRPPSAWSLYRRPILAGLALVTLQAALVVGLLVQARRRRGAERSLDERLRFETLLSDLTRSVAHAGSGALDVVIDRGLASLAQALAVDRAMVAESMEASGDFKVVYAFVARPEVPPLPAVLEAARFPWASRRLREGYLVRFSRPSDMPDEAAIDRTSAEALGTHAAILIPLTVGDAPLGVLGLGILHEHAWPSELLARLELSAEIFSSALMRRRFERLLEESRGLGRSLFSSLHGQAAILDQRGTVVAVNEAWAHAGGAVPEAAATARVGDSYLEFCRAAAGPGEPDAESILRGMRSVLAQAASGFSTEYRRRTPGGERWLDCWRSRCAEPQAVRW
jgi:ABC-type uncharacterized transport system substrate-binding protein/PAS domain-containing protein